MEDMSCLLREAICKHKENTKVEKNYNPVSSLTRQLKQLPILVPSSWLIKARYITFFRTATTLNEL